jgi:threonine dehydrogenase-like Zn-dependent dehydrogenase
VLSIAVCHKGATHQVHVEINDDLLTQYHRAESLFFSADTCGEWLDDLSSRIQRLHGDTRVVLLLDAATQHHAAFTARRAEGKLGDIVVVGIPPKMTHFFQQADQAIKACIVSS